jgi:hypothetical protein
MANSLFFLLSREARATPVYALRLGIVADELEKAGLTTLGALLGMLEADPRGLRNISRLRDVGLKRVQSRVQILAAIVDVEGNVSWDRFDNACRNQGGPYTDGGDANTVHTQVPKAGGSENGTHDEPAAEGNQSTEAESGSELVPSCDTQSGQDFIDSLPEVIAAIIRTRTNEADRLILEGRLAKQPHERKTLEQIAAAVPGALSRERIRQREKKLLGLISNALLFGRSLRLGVSFRTDFRSYWENAAAHFSEKEEVTFAEFIGGLQEVWKVSAGQLFPHLPLITSVLTSRATIPEHIRNHLKLDPRIFRELDQSARGTRIMALPCGKAASKLRAYDIETIGELFDALRSGTGPGVRAGRAVDELVAALVAGITDCGTVDWARFEQKLGVVRLPNRDPESVEEFLQKLIADLRDIIQANRTSDRAADVFSIRIAVPKSKRPTLAEAAAEMNTHGPSIKREESLLLATLNNQLIGRDLTEAAVSIAPCFQGYWEEANVIYKACDSDFLKFCSLLSEQWLAGREIQLATAEVLWAVLDQYPSGRPRSAWKRAKVRSKGAAPVVDSQVIDTVIVLRGFRRVH